MPFAQITGTDYHGKAATGMTPGPRYVIGEQFRLAEILL
jgi:hypothetical protein